MEEVLRGQEIPELKGGGLSLPPELSYDLKLPVLFFPVRHHSPACAFHLKKAIQEYEPESILVEGPENAGALIPVLAEDETQAPIALYYAYSDKEGLISDKKEDYKCYYPFLDFSPELVALREAKKGQIPVHFIDLPYGEILLQAAGERAERLKEGEELSYNDDYLLSRSRFFELLCEKTSLRSFEELWEKYFEIQGLRQTTADFVEQMHTYCFLSRQYTTKQELKEDGCLGREQYMAWKIAEESAKYRKVLVVTGGFHSSGICSLLEKKSGSYEFCGQEVKLHKIPKGDQPVYPMSYSMEAADALNGYASGMQSPGFYQRVWETLDEKENTEGAYRDAALHYLALSGKKARQKDEGISSYDEICGYSMAEGLAALRGKKEPGLYELKDAALSSFVKGEYTISSRKPLEILEELIRGSQVGRLCPGADQPPLIGDFEKQCQAFGLKLHSTLETELTLEIFRSRKHLKLSRFLHQTDFLACGFAHRKEGADLVRRRDKNRIREIWRYKWSSRIIPALIEYSVSGGTVEEAVRAQLNSRLSKSTCCREAAQLLVKGFLMGIADEQRKMGEEISRVLVQDGDFFSLSEGFSYLLMLKELRELYKVSKELDLQKLLQGCFHKLIGLLPSMGTVAEEQEEQCTEVLRMFYQTMGREGCEELRPVYKEALERLLAQKEIRPRLEGTALGLLYGYDASYERQMMRAAEGYIRGTEEMVKQSAAFLQGLFFTARDFVFGNPSFIELLDELFARLSAEEFMQLLPQLRMAFTWFTPLETDRLAGKAAALYGKQGKDILRARPIRPEEYAYGEQLNRYVSEKLQNSLIIKG
ncbi:MAG: hypothetical protein IJP31_08155 [Lachnospiraceae bacterium]|nr:hypothetical protein [Lachnospiraceae bacterium]